MERIFKIRCSQIGKIMGKTGLTDSQHKILSELQQKEKRTEKQEETYNELLQKHLNPELPQTCKTFLHEWYANDNEEIYSKYMEKGIAVENDLIDMAADVLGYGMASKNMERLEDDYMSGECDVVFPDCIVDVKASWNNKTLQEQALNGIDSDYEWQLMGYMNLFRKDKAILFFGLLNTPETDYRAEVIYEDMPIEQRWIGYKIIHENAKVNQIIERVVKCREYLEQYDAFIKSKLGKIN